MLHPGSNKAVQSHWQVSHLDRLSADSTSPSTKRLWGCTSSASALLAILSPTLSMAARSSAPGRCKTYTTQRTSGCDCGLDAIVHATGCLCWGALLSGNSPQPCNKYYQREPSVSYVCARLHALIPCSNVTAMRAPFRHEKESTFTWLWQLYRPGSEDSRLGPSSMG